VRERIEMGNGGVDFDRNIDALVHERVSIREKSLARNMFLWRRIAGCGLNAVIEVVITEYTSDYRMHLYCPRPRTVVDC
jgi:hypothetical protein